MNSESAPPLGELGAVPKVALLIEFDERKMVVSIACFTHLVRWFLAGKFLLVNLIGDALEAIRPVAHAARQHRRNEKSQGETKVETPV